MLARTMRLQERFESAKYIVVFIFAFLIVVAFIIISYVMVHNTVVRNIEDRAKVEIREEASLNAGHIDQMLDERFSDLENAAVYTVQLMSQHLDPSAFLTTILKGHEYCTVAVTDSEGNIEYFVRSDEAVLSSNVSSSGYFIEAVSSADARALSYKVKTAVSEDPQFILAVPLVSGGQITGVLFGSIKPAILDEELWTSGSYGNGKEVFITDANGMIINEHGEHFPLHANLYGLFGKPESAITVFDSVASGKGGDIDFVAEEPGFLSLRPVNGGDWFVYIYMDGTTASEKYMDGLAGVILIFRIIAVLFLAVTGFVFIVMIFVFHNNRKRTREIRENLTRVNNYIAQTGGGRFEYDIRSMKLICSDGVDKILGYHLPQTWFSELDKRIDSNPNFEYSALLNTYHRVLYTKKFADVTLSIGRGRSIKFLTISMIPIFDRSGRVTGVFGTVKDDTLQYAEKNHIMYENELLIHSMLESCLCLVTCNLDENSCTFIATKNGDVVRTDPGISYVDFLAGKAASISDPAVKAEFNEKFSRDKLRTQLADRDSKVSLDYPTQENDEIFWRRMTVSALREKEEYDLRVFLTEKDITTEKTDEIQLQRNLDLAIQNMPGYICKWAFVANDILLLDANQDFFRFMRTTREQAIGQSIIYGFSHEEKKAVIDDFTKSASDRSVISYTGHAFRFDGDEMWINVHGTYYSEEKGTVIYYCILSDVSRMYLLDAENRVYREKLAYLGEMRSINAIEYRIDDRKLKLLSGFNDEFADIINGHSPEYMVHHGIVDSDSLPEYYKLVTSIESGIPQDEEAPAVITFRTNDDKKKRFSCTYRTYCDFREKPVSAVIVFNELENQTESADTSANGRRNKLLVVNLTTDSVEFESDPDDCWSVEDVSSFTKTKYQWVSSGYIHRDNAAEFFDLLDAMRLRSAFESGVSEHSMEFQGSVGDGEYEPFSVKAVLSRNDKTGEFKAYVMIYRELSEAETGGYTVGIHDVSIRAFGHFDVFVDGIPIAFQNSKAKEMLAVLVDRRGGYVTNSEMISYLWEDEPANRVTMARCRQVACRLKRTLEENGIVNIMESTNGKRRIIPEKFKCDYIEYMNDRVKNKALFTDAYMIDYSWSEYTFAHLKEDRTVW